MLRAWACGGDCWRGMAAAGGRRAVMLQLAACCCYRERGRAAESVGACVYVGEGGGREGWELALLWGWIFAWVHAGGCWPCWPCWRSKPKLVYGEALWLQH